MTECPHCGLEYTEPYMEEKFDNELFHEITTKKGDVARQRMIFPRSLDAMVFLVRYVSLDRDIVFTFCNNMNTLAKISEKLKRMQREENLSIDEIHLSTGAGNIAHDVDSIVFTSAQVDHRLNVFECEVRDSDITYSVPYMKKFELDDELWQVVTEGSNGIRKRMVFPPCCGVNAVLNEVVSNDGTIDTERSSVELFGAFNEDLSWIWNKLKELRKEKKISFSEVYLCINLIGCGDDLEPRRFSPQKVDEVLELS